MKYSIDSFHVQEFKHVDLHLTGLITSEHIGHFGYNGCNVPLEITHTWTLYSSGKVLDKLKGVFFVTIIQEQPNEKLEKEQAGVIYEHVLMAMSKIFKEKISKKGINIDIKIPTMVKINEMISTALDSLN